MMLGIGTCSDSVWARCGHEIRLAKPTPSRKCHLTWGFPVVGTGVDPVTSRFSGWAASMWCSRVSLELGWPVSLPQLIQVDPLAFASLH